jgi:hypothetical protein
MPTDPGRMPTPRIRQVGVQPGQFPEAAAGVLLTSLAHPRAGDGFTVTATGTEGPHAAIVA